MGPYDAFSEEDWRIGWTNWGKSRRKVSDKTNPTTMDLDTFDFKIMEAYQAGVYLAIRIKYGNMDKILVFDGVKVADLKRQKSIDPTISANKSIFSPIAQFENNNDGWSNAMKFCSMLHSERLDLSY